MVSSNISKLIAGFILLIIGIVLVGQVATMGTEITNKLGSLTETQTLVTNGTDLNTSGMIGSAYRIINYPTGWKVDDCPITEFTLKNSTGSALVEDTDFYFTEANGTFVLIRTDLTKATLYPTNISYQTYQYCGDEYMNLSWGRTGINLVPGFFAIAILLMAVGLFYSVAKESGIIK